MLDDVHHQRGLAHRGSGGDDEHLPGLEALAHAVEIGVAGGDALGFHLACEHFLKLGPDFGDLGADVEARLGLGALPDAQHLLFDLVEQHAGVLRVFVGLCDGLGAGADDRSQDVLLLDDLEVGREVRGVRRVGVDVGNGGTTANVIEDSAVVEELDQRHEFDLRALVIEVAEGVEEQAVGGKVEVLAGQVLFPRLGDVLLGVLEHRRKDALLGAERIGQRAAAFIRFGGWGGLENWCFGGDGHAVQAPCPKGRQRVNQGNVRRSCGQLAGPRKSARPGRVRALSKGLPRSPIRRLRRPTPWCWPRHSR